MRPLVWTDRRAAAFAAALAAWMASVELGTSRRASRAAAVVADVDEVVVDTETSRLFDAAAVVAIAGAVAASVAVPAASIRSRRASYFAGIGLLGASGMLSSRSRQQLGRFHRDSLTIQSDHQLVDAGPYRRVRHPLYLATIGVFVGFGAVLGNWISLAVAALPTWALIHRINIEEAMLDDAFGASYVRYRERTARLVPGVW